MNGTPRELVPIAEEVLVWVAAARKIHSEDDIRRIELCALAVREWGRFLDLYGLEAPEVP